MAVSGTTTFTTTTNIDLIIRDAYERCGILPNELTTQKMQSALLSCNLVLQRWANGIDGIGSLMLSTVQKCMFQMNVGQPTYYLPAGTVEILEVTASNVTRILGGMAYSSAGGDADNAFSSGNLACTQTSPNGYISYDWGTNNPAIYYVGIQSNVTTEYTLTIDFSFDGDVWFEALNTYANQYAKGQIIWWVIPVPVNVMQMRVREYGGATLDIQQIYFDIPQPTSRLLAPIARDTWMAYGNKINRGGEGNYYFDKATPVNLTLYPTPDNTYSTIVYTRERQIYDVTQLTQNIDLKQTFYMAFISALAADLALKCALDRYDRLKMIAYDDYLMACKKDTQVAPISIFPSSYYGV